MKKPLTQRQIIALAGDAKKAFDAVPAEELDALREKIARGKEAGGDPFACAAAVGKTLLFTEWRRRETAAALAEAKRPVAESFKDLSNGDFAVVRARFLRRFNPRAADALVERDRARRLLWLIRRECATSSGAMRFPAYPETICRMQYRRSLDEASSDELRRILITLVNRKKAKHV